MKQFQQIEKFLEKVVDKNTLPEGLGEGPEYKIIEKKKHSGRNGKPHKRNTKGAGKGTHKGASKGQNKGQHKQKGKSEEK